MNLSKPNYKAWAIDAKDFPAKGSVEDKIRFIIGYGILAPSTHNTQPWLFDVNHDTLQIIPDFRYLLPAADPVGRHLCISLGAFGFNIIVAANHFGFSTHVTYRGATLDDASIQIEFSNSGKTDSELVQLFEQIPRRSSEKRILKSSPISKQEIALLSDATYNGANASLIDDKTHINALAKLSFGAAASYAKKPEFAKELSTWIRGNNTKENDGMPGFTNGLSNPKTLIGKNIMKIQPKFLKIMAKKYDKMIQTSPALGVIATSKDSWQQWIDAGFAYEKLSLLATTQQISLSPVAALIERPERQKLKKYFPRAKYPQLFFRLIKIPSGISVVHAPRRRLTRQSTEDVLVGEVRRTGVEAKIQSINIGKVRINYLVAGQGEPLLLIHGANLGWGQWSTNIPALAEHYKVFAIDLPGCGGSTPINFRKTTLETGFVEPVMQFMNALHLTSCSVIGHSFGGAIAIKLASKPNNSINKLVLVNPMGFTLKVTGKQKLATIYPFAKFLSKTAVKPNRKNMQKFLAEPLVQKDSLNQPLVDYYWAALQENQLNHPILFMNSLTQPLRIKSDLKLSEDMKHITQPTLVIASDKDYLTPIKIVRKKMPIFQNAQLKVFKDTGHVPPLEKTTQFNREVISFLNGQQ